MATTSVWAVNDNLKRVLDYTSNKEKTENKEDDLSQVLSYASNANKTNNMSFVSGINLDPAHAYEQMMMVKKQFNKTDGVIAFHGYHSFSPGEVDPVTAHNLTRELMHRWLGDEYQVLLCTHLDQQHIHTHFVINSVSWTTGKKFKNQHADYRRLRELSDEICKEHGLHVIEDPGYSKHYAEQNSMKQFNISKRTLIKKDVDYCISISLTWTQFIRNLEKLGYHVKIGKHFSILPPGEKRYYRTYNLTKTQDYSEDGIREMIRLRTMFIKPVVTPTTKYFIKGSFKNTRKITGIRALYFRYLYELGILPKHYPKKYVHPLIKKDLLKINKITEEVTFMSKRKIDTKEELNLYESNILNQLESLTKRNRALCNKINRCDDIDLKTELINQHDSLLNQITKLRKETKIIANIYQRNESMKKTLDEMKKEETSKEKNKEQTKVR